MCVRVCVCVRLSAGAAARQWWQESKDAKALAEEEAKKAKATKEKATNAQRKGATQAEAEAEAAAKAAAQAAAQAAAKEAKQAEANKCKTYPQCCGSTPGDVSHLGSHLDDVSHMSRWGSLQTKWPRGYGRRW